MNYLYFADMLSEIDSTNSNETRRAIALYRVNNEEFTAERYMGANKWELDESGDVVGSTLLGMEYWYEYDEISKSEAEKLKQDLFPEINSSTTLRKLI